MKNTLCLFLVSIFTSHISSAQTFEWAKKMGGTFHDQGESVVVDDSCNVYSTGGFYGPADFDPNSGVYTLGQNGGNSQIYVQKMDPNGNLVWAVSMGGGYQDIGYSITVDNSGDIYVTGLFLGTVDFDPDPNVVFNLTSTGGPNHYNTFIVKLTPGGQLIWAKRFAANYPVTIRTDAAGNVYTAGNFTGTVNFNPGIGTPAIHTTTGYIPFVQKLLPNGAFDWVQVFGSPCIANHMDLDPTGNILLTGYFSGTLNFITGVGTANLSAISSWPDSDAFVVKLDPNGGYLWAKGLGGVNASTEGIGITSDNAGNVFSTGRFRGTVDFDPNAGSSSLTAAGTSWDVYVHKLDPAGNLLAAKRFGGGGSDLGESIDVDASNNVYISGNFSGTGNFNPSGTSTLTSSGSTDIFIQKLDNSLGTLLDVRKMGGSGGDEVKCIHASATGSVLSTGFFIGNANFGVPLSSSGNREIWVHKLSNPAVAPTVVATQPNVSMCCPGPVFDLGVEYIPTGDVYSTNGLFTPVNATPGTQPGGHFVNLPGCVTTQDIGNDRYYQFDPCVCGPGTYDIIYAFTDSCGNTGMDTMTITVETGPTVSFTPLTIDICGNSGPVPIIPVSNGVSCQVTGPFVNASGEFDAIAAGIGTHMVQIECQSANGCTTTISGTVIVSGLTISITGAQNLCENDAPITLTANPAGGVWSGTGVSAGGQFDPSVAGVGSHTVTYTYSSSANCTGTESIVIDVNAAPNVAATQPTLTLCCDPTQSSQQTVFFGAVNNNTGNAISPYFTPAPNSLIGAPGGHFTQLPPSSCLTSVQFFGFTFLGINPCNCPPGTYPITYSFTNSAGCSDQATMNVVVDEAPTVSFNPLTIDLCNNYTGPVPIVPVSNGVSCQVTGNYVNASGEFDAVSAGVGTHTVQIECESAGGCTTTISGTINVVGLTIVITPQSDLCESDAPVVLNASPAGGVWSGPGVAGGNQFDPSLAGAGSHTLTYTVALSTGCVGSEQMLVNVTPAPQVAATQPMLNLCCDSTLSPQQQMVFLGAESNFSGNTISPFFTPAPTSLASAPGGQFTQLPPPQCMNTFQFFFLTIYQINTCNCPPGTYPVTYSYTDPSGCSDEATMNIVIDEAPTVSFSPLTIDLCNYTSPVPIVPVSNGANCQVTGNYVNASGEFDAALAGVGTHTVQITCTSAGGCSTTISGTVIVEETNYWHQTTSNATAPNGKGDSGNDIYTDSDGYVYATGSFYSETTFDDGLGNTITITNNVDPVSRKYYLVCYDNCGELQWVMYDSYAIPKHWSEGFGIGKNQDELFVGLNYTVGVEFTTVYPGGSTVTFGTLASGNNNPLGNACVLAINGQGGGTLFGQVDAIEDTYPNAVGRALHARQSAGNVSSVFICGRSDANINQLYKVAYSGLEYNSTNNTLNTVWVQQSAQEHAYNIANDIRWDEVTGRLLITGGFDQELTLFSAPGTGPTLNTSAVSDAFIVTAQANGYIYSPSFLQLGMANGDVAFGTTLTSTDDSHIYFGGIYKGVALAPFAPMFSHPASTSQSASYSSYLLSADMVAGVSAFEEIWNVNTSAKLTGLDARADEVIFTGFYERGVAQTSLPGQIANNSSPSENQVFVGQLDISGGNWSVPEIVNSTATSSTTGFDHRSTRIAIGEGDYGYLTGSYKGNLSYFSGVPASGDLNSSGTGTPVFNAYFMRNDLNTNALNKVNMYGYNEGHAFDPSVLTGTESTVNVYPNPTMGRANAKVIGVEYGVPIQIKVYNLLGEIIVSKTVTSDQFEIDLSKCESGTYLLEVNLPDKVEELRIIRL